MNESPFTLGLIAVMSIVLGIFAVIQTKKRTKIRKKHPGFPKGYWMNRGIGQGIAIGVGIGVVMENIAIGVAIGVAIGTGIGTRLEKKHKNEIRPMTDEEKKLKKQSVLFSIGTIIFGIIFFIVTYFIAK